MKTTFAVVGDMLVQRRIQKESIGFSDISNHLRKSDVRYFNLETTLLRGDYYANQLCGGSYLRADPSVLEDAKAVLLSSNKKVRYTLILFSQHLFYH